MLIFYRLLEELQLQSTNIFLLESGATCKPSLTFIVSASKSFKLRLKTTKSVASFFVEV